MALIINISENGDVGFSRAQIVGPDTDTVEIITRDGRNSILMACRDEVSANELLSNILYRDGLEEPYPLDLSDGVETVLGIKLLKPIGSE